MLSKTVPTLHILRNAIVVKIILLQLGWFMFEKMKTTLEKDYYLNSNPFFSEEKRKLSIIYIYPNQVFVEKTSHAELKNDVVNLAELNRIVHCLLNIYTGYLLPVVHSLTYWKLVREFSSFWKHVIIDRKMILRYIAPEIKIKYNFFLKKTNV